MSNDDFDFDDGFVAYYNFDLTTVVANIDKDDLMKGSAVFLYARLNTTDRSEFKRRGFKPLDIAIREEAIDADSHERYDQIHSLVNNLFHEFFKRYEPKIHG